uniref:Metastriate one of each protein family n=1 Tax=Rhipicephalus appendiculatus TaxID=34631 RepID=A0A131YNW2_RHIAP
MGVLAVALALFATHQLGSAESVFSKVTAARCYHTPDVDWSESVNAYLRKIPETMRMGYLDDSWLSGFSLDNPKLAGLGSMWSFKPPYVFCATNLTIIEAAVFAEDPLRISVDWKSCAGSNGTLGSTVSASRLRLYFSVVSTTEGSHEIRLRAIKPDNLENPKLFVTGTSHGMSAFVKAISVVGMPHLELAWNSYLRDDVPSLIDALAA